VAQLQLVVGPVGAGKSTLALRLAREHRAIRLTLDEWMVTLFRKDRPATNVMAWYVERTQRCIEQIWRIADDAIAIGTNVVLEIGLIQQRDRIRFYERLDTRGHGLTIHVVDAPRELRRERVMRRNREQGATFSMEVPPEIFELASDLWQPPTAAECVGRDVRFVVTE
jgi:predicted kinase